ncbi:PQQ-dependent sugar dehydrogenase [Domibacillus enclensis]|uniref:Glucose/arabinose dehydrogenase, beta-propeller fold n=1 Tax=Domibacillus enclensis TaxID=1017273 RepID=A0A1N6ZHW5_9BACI|nr:PQQ-dependent sugar dehydrogenase [Domibacillus enclensis]OXS76707.1 quinoprotein glucose dehydrogenase [Domibacillus enclensis]SIR26321.1 Glucose/arabinose dehydrogenase, beta-propeller fold [Domibacillus enclensis]
MAKKWLAGLLLLTGCGVQEPEQPESERIQSEAENLDVPWSIEQHEDTFYISERPGTIAEIENGEVEHQSVRLEEPLSDAAEAGLLGFVLKPDFDQSSEAYAYYTYDQEGEPVNRIVTLELNGDYWRETETVLDGIPSGNVHHGGRLEIGPDDALYATIGDASDPEIAQDPDSFNGKIVRMDEAGEMSIFSLGHRNPQGIAWSEAGTMYASEHGQSANDEINVIEEGRNYGWPDIEGTEEAEGLTAPLATSGADETWAPSGMVWHQGELYAASLRGEAVLKIDPETGDVTKEIEGYGRIRDVFSDGDSLYFVTNNTDGRGNPAEGDDKLYRIAE